MQDDRRMPTYQPTRLASKPCHPPRRPVGNTFARANATPPSRGNRGKMKFSASGPAGSYGKGGRYGNTFARSKASVHGKGGGGARNVCASEAPDNRMSEAPAAEVRPQRGRGERGGNCGFPNSPASRRQGFRRQEGVFLRTKPFWRRGNRRQASLPARLAGRRADDGPRKQTHLAKPGRPVRCPIADFQSPIGLTESRVFAAQGLTDLGSVPKRPDSFQNFPKLSVSFCFVPPGSAPVRGDPVAFGVAIRIRGSELGTRNTELGTREKQKQGA